MSIEIAPIAERHFAELHSVFDAVAREKLYLAYEEAPPLDATWDYLRMQKEQGVHRLVALVDEAVVGWCDLQPMNDLSSRRHCGLLGMGLVPLWRGRGLGAQLLKAILVEAEKDGIRRVELTVFDHNTSAIRLYERQGFITEGLMRDAIQLDGRYHNVLTMARLTPSPLFA